MTGGSILWRTLTSRHSVTAALTVSAAGLMLTILLALRWRMPNDAATVLAPSNHWAEPVMAIPLAGDRGPVLIAIDYRVAPERQADVIAALWRFRSVRQRDGAIRWDVWEDVSDPGRVVEGFVVESWIEHQRQHARVTRTDALDQELLNAFHIGEHPPVVRHLLRPL